MAETRGPGVFDRKVLLAASVDPGVQGARGAKRNSHLFEALLRARGSEMDSWKRFSRVSLAVAVIALFVVSVMPTGQSTSLGVAIGVPARTLDDLFGQVAARVPAFGGMYLQGNTLMVYLTSPSERMAAVQAIQAVFGAGRIPAGGVQILPATYGFAQLATWHARMGSLFGIRGVFLTDIDETANRLKIGVVPNPLAVGAVEARLAAMGIPRRAVRIVPMQPFATPATLRDHVRPIEGGLPIARSVFLCTLGRNGVRARLRACRVDR